MTNNRKPGVLLNWQLILYGTTDLSPMAIPQSGENDQEDIDVEVGDNSGLNEDEKDFLSAVLGNTNEEQQDINYEEIKILHDNDIQGR